jgi:hypothetical protein
VVIDRGAVVVDAGPGEIKARIPARRVCFSVRGGWDADSLRDVSAHDGEVTGDTVRLLSGDPERLLRALFARGLDIRDLTVERATLEEALYAVTEPPGRTR